ncbi:lysyl-tRNA synthetase class 1 [Thermosporothrix hazakensis]|jgi:lysyl-tRNA synthetase class 1|uniref:Lysyl-tRNA synthetase class 1 n=1 Tax=Thermosporothrix hazakensis TaxID=644383 RepID=A0A326U8G9_THEHA|nr:hypothetical protein [Thermosporothrix hazakensis]PZW31925.1 lysyl-tRNA synthetase class 1 [Thermosporothrix hazakensis]GCE49750.1 hypothetical protein KTH_46190 [Thermosporothrix hazakensis]
MGWVAEAGAGGHGTELNRNIYRRACQTVSSEVERTPKPVSFSLLTSLLDVTHENIEQVMRIVSQSTGDAMLSPEMLEPRLTCARNWINDYLPDDERTPIQSTFQTAAYEQMSEEQRRMISLFSSLLNEHWNYVGLTDLMYNVPEMVRGVPLDVKPDTALKQVQRSFFVAIYQLVCGRETGPRIPTLLLSLGREKTHMLVTPPRKEACSSL